MKRLVASAGSRLHQHAAPFFWTLGTVTVVATLLACLTAPGPVSDLFIAVSGAGMLVALITTTWYADLLSAPPASDSLPDPSPAN